MEIQYKRTYRPGGAKRYALGEIPAMLGYAMEVIDPRVVMREGKLAAGQMCMLFFGITPEEYALKDGDAKALNHLADKLLKQIPADRLLGWRIVDLKGETIQSALQPQTGESIDGGEFARRVQARMAQSGPIDAQLLKLRALQQQCAAKDAPESEKEKLMLARRALANALKGLETLYVAFDGATGQRWPVVGYDGRLEFFTTEERAKRACEQLNRPLGSVKIWEMRALKGEEIQKLISECIDNGLNLLRLDNGFAAAELSMQDICKDAPGANASLRSMMIREVEYGMRWNLLRDAKADEAAVRGALESMLTMRNFAWRELGNAKLFALCVGGQRDKCVVLGNQKQPEKMLAVFSSQARALHFAKQLKEAVQSVEMDFDALKNCCNACDGVLVDMGFIGYRLLKGDFDKVLDLRGKPPVAVRVRAAEQKPAPRPAQDLGDLPDPDVFLPSEEEREEKQEETVATQQPPQKKEMRQRGLFQKLFKK